jgi:hypothetical protein
MEKIKKPIIKSLPPLDIYPTDIKQISDVLKTTCDEITIRIEDEEENEYLLDDAEEIKGIKASKGYIRKLHITGNFKDKRSRISIDFEKGIFTTGAGILSLEVQDNNATVIGILTQVEEILLEKKNRWRTFLLSTFMKFFLLLLSLVSFFNLVSQKNDIGLVLLYVCMLFLIWGLTKLIDSLVPNTFVYTLDKQDRPSYWARQKDHIITGLIYSLITGIIIALLTFYLTKKYLSSHP